MNPLLVHRLLRDEHLIATTNNTAKEAVDKRVSRCFVIANEFYWDTASISKKSVFLTGALEHIIIDSGASFCLTHCKYDFITPITEPSIPSLKTVKDTVEVKGEGTVEWTARDINGSKITLTVKALYVPEGNICLFPPRYG